MKTKLFAALLIVPLLFTASCKKTDGPSGINSGRMTVRMTDAPSPFGYQEVNIDVRSVEVHFADGNWQAVHITPGIYNVLTLCNGRDTLIASEDLPAGQITGLRLNLGSNNSLRKSGIYYPLTIPSGEESGLKVVLNENVGLLPLNLFLDFDAGQSIVQDGNHAYHLKPVIHVFTETHTGTVHGTLTAPGPGVAVTLTMANANGPAYTTYADALSGQFMLRGLSPGIYTATVYTIDSEIVFNNISVTEGHTTEMGTLEIR